MTKVEKKYEESNNEKIFECININKIINSSMADDDTKGDKVFEYISNLEKNEYKEVTLDFTDIELVNTAFLNNAVGTLFDPNKFDMSKCKVFVSGMDETMTDLLRETIRVARQKFVQLQNIGKSDSWIAKHLGMDLEEIIRFKQIICIAELFKNRNFSTAWEPV